jgi:hypothetical protein
VVCRADKNWKTFGYKFQAVENYFIFCGYFCRSRQKLVGRWNYPGLSSGGLYVTVENNMDIFLATIFGCFFLEGFNTSPFQFYVSFKLKNHKYTHNHTYIQSYTIIIHKNLIHSTLPSIHISHIHSSLIYLHKSVMHTHQSLVHRYTTLIHIYRLQNFHYALGGLLGLWLPPEAKRALSKAAPDRGWNK